MNCISNCRVKNDSDLPIDKGYAWVIVAGNGIKSIEFVIPSVKLYDNIFLWHVSVL